MSSITTVLPPLTTTLLLEVISKRIYNMATKLGQLEWFGSIVSEIECFEMRNKSELIDIITKSTDQLVIARNAAAGSLLLHKVLAEKAEAASAEPLD